MLLRLGFFGSKLSVRCGRFLSYVIMLPRPPLVTGPAQPPPSLNLAVYSVRGINPHLRPTIENPTRSMEGFSFPLSIVLAV